MASSSAVGSARKRFRNARILDQSPADTRRRALSSRSAKSGVTSPRRASASSKMSSSFFKKTCDSRPYRVKRATSPTTRQLSQPPGLQGSPDDRPAGTILNALLKSLQVAEKTPPPLSLHLNRPTRMSLAEAARAGCSAGANGRHGSCADKSCNS